MNFNAANRVDRFADADGNAMSFTSSGHNNLTPVQAAFAGTLTIAGSTGRLTSLTQFNGTTVEYGYDDAARLTSLQNKNGSTVFAGYAFTLDGNGNRTQIVPTEPLNPTPTLTERSYTYNTQKNRLTSDGTSTFTYDDEGQLETDGYNVSYTFDYEHRLTAIDGTTNQYVYDFRGNRIQATRNSVVTRYIYDAAGNLLAEADGSNTITRYYIYGLGLVAMATPANAVYCYHFNATGSTIAITNSSGTVVSSYAYDTFGYVKGQQEGTGLSQPFKYVGQYGVMAESVGARIFYYMRARYYDPSVGRFISGDPAGFGGGDVNLYAYVGGNPVIGIDPSGLAWMEIRPLDVSGLRHTTVGSLYHSGFVYDNGLNSSYAPSHSNSSIAVVGRDEGASMVTSQYQHVGEYLQDDILRQAETNLRSQWDQTANPNAKGYNTVFHNCHDYTDAVLNEYNGIVGIISSTGSQNQHQSGK